MAAKLPSKYLRTVDDVCGVLGIRIPKQRNRAAKLRAPVLEWTQQKNLPKKAPPFPARERYGWVRAEVLRWQEARRNGNGAHPPDVGFNPGAAHGKSDGPTGDLFQPLSPDELFQANQERLQRNLLIHLGKIHSEKPLMKFQVEELIANGLLPRTQPVTGNGEGKNLIGGLEGVAEYLRQEFKYPCDKMTISRWQHGRSLPPGCPESFPLARESGRYDRAEVDVWARKYLPNISPEKNLVDAPTDHRSRQEKADADLAEMKAEQMRRSVSDKWLEAEVVIGFIKGFAGWLATQQDRLIEDRGGVRSVVARVVGAVLAPPAAKLAELDARLTVELAAANDAMKAAAERQMQETLGQMESQRAETVALELAG